MDAKLIFPAKNIVGESLVWDTIRNRLLWVDIVGKTIHALDPETGEHQVWRTPEFVTSLGLRKDGGAVVAFMKSICLWDYGDEFIPLAQIESDLPGNRLNEGVVGPDGAFWIGTMQNNIAPDGSAADITEHTGQLFRCTADGQVKKICDDKFGITNTFVWTEGGRLIVADTLKNGIYSYHLDSSSNCLKDRRTIISGFERGLPDGSTTNSSGNIWNCRVLGGSCLLLFAPDGKILQVHDLPCLWPTSCVFGGQNLDTLYVTSARFTMSHEHLEENPQEGGLFAFKPEVGGQPGYRFG